MKNILEECIEKIQKNHRSIRRYTMVFVVLALLVFAGVNWKLHQQGISMTADYQCGMEEHHHTEACYKKVLICEKEETDGSEGHIHTETCYEQRNNLICQITEHTHGEECYDENGNLICGQEEHVHDQSCYRMENVLICGQEESAPVEAHHHTEVCYESQLTCQITEHTHSVECMIDESADVETASDWEATIPGNLSGKWAEDLVAVAKSQLGYQESTANFRLAEDGQTHQGYTRYGAWYGNPYGDWCAMFASFCLHYAQIPESFVPVNSGSAAWIPQLQNVGIYDTPDDYSPQSGDLVFFDTDANGSADHVGIVESVTDSHMTVVEGNSSDMVKENTYSLNDGTVVGYGKLPENPETVEEDSTKEDTEITQNVTINKSKMRLMAAARSVSGLDITDTYVTDVTLKKKEGVIWVEANEFTTDDQAQAEIFFAGLTKEILAANNNIIKIQLPEGFECQKFVNNTYITYDKDVQSGTYVYQKDENGNWYIVLTLLDDYVNGSSGNIGGSVKLEFEWDSNSASEEGKKQTISLGQWEEEITVKTGQKTDTGETGVNYSLSKQAGSLSYDSNGKAYIDYMVTLEVKADTSGPICMNDNLTGTDWTYTNDSLCFTSEAGTEVGWTIAEDSKSAEINIGNEETIIKAGTYTISYKIENSNISNPNISSDSNVSNRVSIKDGDKNLTSDTWTNTSKKIIDKQGKLTDEGGTSYIDYTIYINTGDIIQNIPSETTFADTIPEDLELTGDVSVKQYDINGNENSISDVSIVGNSISCNLPEGQYYYIITYKTKIKDTAEIPIGGKDVVNTANVSGGLTGSDSEYITIPNHVLSKSFKSQEIQKAEGKWVDTIHWESTIDISGSLNGYVYEDWGNVGYYNGELVKLQDMTDEQRSAIQIYAGEQLVDSSNYRVESSNHTESNGIVSGLFKITFTNEISGPVTIRYETTADLSNYNLGDFVSFINYASLAKDGNVDYSQAQSGSIQYSHEKPDIIKKSKTGGEAGDSTSTTLLPGENSIPWVIVVNQGKILKEDLTVTDTIADAMSFVEDSLKITVWGNDITSLVTWDFDKNTSTLTIHISKELYSGENYSNPIQISYKTELPKSYYDDNNLTSSFENTVSVSGSEGTSADSTFTQEVTRQVVGKSGNYDKESQILTYNIVLNPDGTRLNNGEKLIVTDTLNGGSLNGHIKLKGLKLFTAIKTTNLNGDRTVEPGTFVSELIESTEEELYHYSWDTDNNQFITYIPDSTAYVLVAEYLIDVEVAENVSLSNSVELSGIGNQWNASDNSTSAEKSTSGQTHRSTDTIDIIKHDMSQYNVLLSEATFELKEYKDNTWGSPSELSDGTSVSGSLTTGTSGKASTVIKKDTLYCLIETVAPTDYIMDSTPYYFIVIDEGNIDYSLPDSISGDDSYKKDSVVVYTMKAGENANIEIHRYNAKNTTIVHEKELRINKQWRDSEGNTITDALELAALPDVKISLTKHEPAQGYKISLQPNAMTPPTVFASNINYGGYIYVVGNVGSWNSIAAEYGLQVVNTGETSNWEQIYTIGPVNSNITITNQNLYYNSGKYNGNVEGKGSVPSGMVDKVLGTVTLNAANDWSYLWTGLTTDDGSTYSLEEETIDGYKATYQLNDSTDSEELTFTPSSDGDTITVTNTAESQTEDSGYELPKTGGSGTVLFTLGGVFLMGAAMWYEYILKCRRERRRR